MDRVAHAALDYPLAERVDYLHVLAALVGADANIHAHELGVLEEFCTALEVDDASRHRILAFTRKVEAGLVRETCERLRTSELRFTLASDLLYIAYSDAHYGPAEREVVEGIARLLGIGYRQLDAMESYARAVLAERMGNLPTDVRGDNVDHDLRPSAIAGLAAAGVPLAAVALAGAGLGPTSIAAGLATLGLGAVGAGVGVAAALGIGSFFAVRELYRRMAV